MRIYALGWLLVFAAPALAMDRKCPVADQALEVLSRSASRSPTVVTVDPNGASPADAAAMAAVIPELNAILHPRLIVPEAIELTLAPQGPFAAAIANSVDARTGQLIAPCHPSFLHRRSGTFGPAGELRHGNALLAHEYGHLVFEANIFSRLSPAARVRAEHWHDESHRLMAERKKFSVGDPKRDAVDEQLVALRREYDAQHSVFAEAFGDLLAHIYVKDGKTLREALDFSGGEDSKDDGDLRDPTILSKLNKVAEKAEDPHAMFVRLTNHAWMNYLSKPEFKGKEVDILEAFLDASAAEFNAGVEKPEILALTAKERNARLRLAFAKEMQKRRLAPPP